VRKGLRPCGEGAKRREGASGGGGALLIKGGERCTEETRKRITKVAPSRINAMSSGSVRGRSTLGHPRP
jgi:hypothetical protein